MPWLNKATLDDHSSLPEQLEGVRAKYPLRAKLRGGAASPVEDASAQPRKRHLTSAFEWLLLCDLTFRVSTAAADFGHSCISENGDRRPLQWPP